MPICIPFTNFTDEECRQIQILLRGSVDYIAGRMNRKNFTTEETFIGILLTTELAFNGGYRHSMVDIKNRFSYINDGVYETDDELDLCVLKFDIVREELKKMVEADSIIRKYNGTKATPFLRFYVSMCRICNSLIIGPPGNIFINHVKESHKTFPDGTPINLNMDEYGANCIDAFIVNVLDKSKENKYALSRSWRQQFLQNNNGNPRDIVVYSHTGKDIGKACIFCGIMYEGMNNNDLSMLRTRWASDVNPYKHDDDNYPKSYFTGIIVQHLMEKHFANVRNPDDPLHDIWLYASEGIKNEYSDTENSSSEDFGVGDSVFEDSDIGYFEDSEDSDSE